MNKIANISLDTHFAEFVEQQVEEGHYGSVSEVVSAALALLEEQDEYAAYVRAALIEAENSGPPEPFDFDEFIARKKAARTR